MKKLFGKRGIALLTTMAILVSLVAMLGGLSLTSGAAYTPKRTITFTVSEGIQQSCLMLKDAFKVAGGKAVKVKGYYKVDSITGDGFNVVGTQATTTATDGWQAFSIDYNVPGAAEWKDFGFWQASGKFALADITFEDAANGTVYYDMATDENLTAGTYSYGKSKGYDDLSIWYIMGAYGTVADGATCEVVVDPVYVPSSTPAYTPKRTVTFTVSEGIQQSCLMLKDAFKVAGGKAVKVKGYYKVDSITGDGFNVVGTQATTTATDGWQAFSIDYNVPGAAEWKDFGFWQASGKFALADIIFEDAANGTVYYDMATDENLTAGTYSYGKSKGYDDLSIWYIMGAYGTVADGATCEVVVDPVYVPSYEPNRAVTFTVSSGSQQTCMMLEDAYKVAAGKTVTISGYYKIDSFTAETAGGHFGIFDIVVKEATDGWVPFTTTYTVPTAGEWKSFGFWEASGSFALADITFTEGETVWYDMATDANLPAGTYNFTKAASWQKHSIWYLMGAYGSASTDTAAVQVVVDPVYVPSEEPAYTPKRVISMTTAGTQINGKIYLYYSNLLGSGKEVTVKGYYKVDGYTVADANQNPKIISDSFGNMTADCEWTAFEKTFTTGEGKALDLEFWYTQGTISFADVTIKDSSDVYIYDMTSDADLVAGTYDSSNWRTQQGIWYFGFYQGIDAATYTVGEPVEGGIVVIPPPYDPEVVELPEIPNMIVADSNGYTPNRAFAIVKGVHTGPKVSYAVFADETNYAVAGNKYYVFLKYAASGLNGAEAAIVINGTTVKTLTANSSAWETLLDENGKPYSFEAVEVDDIVSIVFKMSGNGTGTFAIADFIIADQTGKIVYSLANDKSMHINSDMRYVENGYWKGDPYVAEVEGPTLMPIQTKTETYKPNAYISLTQNDKQRDSSAESFLFLRTDNALFTAGQKYTVKGMIKVDIDAGYGGWANASLGIGSSAGISDVTKVNILDTNGAWLPLLAADGSPVTFTGAANDFFKINLFKTYGTVALADIQILDAQGNVVYDMVTDEALKALEGQYSGNVADLGGAFVHALYNNGVGEVFFADSEQTNTETSKQIPQFEESVEVPQEEVPCEHDFVDGTCTKCGEADPDYVPECEHDFVDGTCTKCGEADPDYVPECEHNFEDGICTECGAEDPDYVPGGDETCEHEFVDGICTKCGELDPDYDFCADGHTFIMGVCIFCGAEDDGNACADGHTFIFGVCIVCGAEDPDFDPCAEGHEYIDGVCIFCGAEESTECEHNFVDGVCTECGEEDPDYVPEEEIPGCEHNFVDGVCTECGEEDPDYVPEEEIPGCEHNFVDGVCTECGEADPDYVEPPVQTGDQSMIFVIALATFAVMALAALTLNKKKFNA